MRNFGLAVGISSSVLLALATQTVAGPTIVFDYAFVDNRPADDLFGIGGLKLHLEVEATDPGGTAALRGTGARATATSSNARFPFAQPIVVPVASSITDGADFGVYLSLTGPGQLPDIRGTYSFTVTDTSSQRATSTSHSLDRLEVIPIPTNLAVSDHSSTPLFTFTDPNPAPGFAGLARTYRMQILDDRRNSLYWSSSSSIPSFRVPPGILAPGQRYFFRAVSQDCDCTEGSSVHSALESRAEAYLGFTPDASAPVLGAGSVASAIGHVTIQTVVSSELAGPGTIVRPGSLIETGSDGTLILAFSAGTQLVVSPNTQVVLLPPAGSTSDDVELSQIQGLLTHSVANPVPGQPDRYRVRTPVAVVQPTGTAFSTEYGESRGVGDLMVTVRQGQTEVAERRGQLTTLIAGQQATFSDAVPRVTPVLPVDRGSVVAGTVNTFSWTSLAGASGYLLEFTPNPSGFAQANPPAPEPGGNVFPIPPGAFTSSGARVELRVLVPPGVLPAGAGIRWRIFATDGAGHILPGSTASDASSLVILGARVSTLAPAVGAVVPEGSNATFSWTAFPGATDYLFEFTVDPAGFAEVNPTAPESPQRTLRVTAGSFSQDSGMVQITVPVAVGVAPTGTLVRWRVFPADATGHVLAGAVASEAGSITLR